jgi:hypothetical protein
MTTRNLSARKVRVSVPWLPGAWMLDDEQRRVVRQLVEAALLGEPGLRLAGVEALLAGTGALGVLAVRGLQGEWRVGGTAATS